MRLHAVAKGAGRERKTLRYLPLYDGGLKPASIDNVLRNGLSVELLDGIGSALLGLHTVELKEGRTREELEAFFRELKPCSNWDAFEKAAKRGIVEIKHTGDYAEVFR